MEQLIGDIIQHIIQLITPFFQKLLKHIVLTALLVLYLAVFWFLFFTKGIYVEGHFYKKSANLTTITYTCRNPAADYKKIVLNKQLDYSLITIDDTYTLTVASDGKVSAGKGTDISLLPHAQWDKIADQSAERNRGFGEKRWILTLALMAAAFIANRYSTAVYSFFHPDRAANDSYYLWVGRIAKAVYIIGLVYLIIPL